MVRKYKKVLELMQLRGGRIDVTDPDLAAMLGPMIKRLSGYAWEIETLAHLKVRGIRQGRRVVAYELESMPATPVSPDKQDDDLCQECGVIVGVVPESAL